LSVTQVTPRSPRPSIVFGERRRIDAFRGRQRETERHEADVERRVRPIFLGVRARDRRAGGRSLPSS
jgi:hypothetical protein